MNEAEARGILGVGPTATLDEAKKAHRSLVKVLHPDLAGPGKDAVDQATQATARVNQAWSVLQDLDARGLLGKFVEEPQGPDVTGMQFRIKRRSPGVGECVICGCYPAKPATFKFVQTVAIWASTGTVSGSLCRACGLEIFRDAQSRNLTRGWWGIGIIFMLVYLFSNASQRRSVLTQPPPAYRDFAVVTPADMPLLPGRPVFRRPSVLVVMSIVGVLVVGFVWASSTPATPRPPSAASSTAGDPMSGGGSGVTPGGSLEVLRLQLIEELERQPDLSPARKACFRTEIQQLDDADLSRLNFELQGSGGITWETIRSACAGPFAGECFSERRSLEYVACDDPTAQWRFVTTIPATSACPGINQAPFTAPGNPIAWCLEPV